MKKKASESTSKKCVGDAICSVSLLGREDRTSAWAGLALGYKTCAQAGTASTQRREYRVDFIRNSGKTEINANTNSSQARFILKLHTSGATNKLLGIFN